MRIDTSGLSCPEPVLVTKKAIKSKPKNLEVVVDNEAALQNVSRFLEKNKYKVTCDDQVIKASQS